MLKRLQFYIAVALAALLAGCATTNDAYYAAVKAQLEAQSRDNVARFQADAARWNAVAAIAPKLDASGAAAATGIAFAQGAAAGVPPQSQGALAIAPPKSGWETAWTTALQVADVGLRVYGIKVGGDVAIRQSDNQAATAIASYGAFTSMGGAIERAGTAGYPYVQSPQPNVTLSGTGVIGSGSYSYTGPVTTTTTRTCSSGPAGLGGAGDPAGGGGASNGGSC